jgi:hypothetical protein
MPRLFAKKDTSIAQKVLSNIVASGIDIQNGDLCSAYYSAKSIPFFDTLAGKLLVMVQSLKEQFQELKTIAYKNVASGPFLASIEVTPPPIGVKYEYIEYINRYGPPADGIFDPVILNSLRIELGITTTVTT